MTEKTRRCARCRGTGRGFEWVSGNYLPDRECIHCYGKGRIATRQKLDTLVPNPSHFLINAVDHALDFGLDPTLPPVPQDEANCAYLVGAKRIVDVLVFHLPYFLIRVETQMTPPKWYYRPVFRKEILLHALTTLFPGKDVSYHLRTLDVRYDVTIWAGRTVPKERKQSRKRWKRIDSLPDGESLA